MDQDLEDFWQFVLQWVQEPQSLIAGIILVFVLPFARCFLYCLGWLRADAPEDADEMHGEEREDQAEPQSDKRTDAGLDSVARDQEHNAEILEEHAPIQSIQAMPMYTPIMPADQEVEGDQQGELDRERAPAPENIRNAAKDDGQKEYYTRMRNAVSSLLESLAVSLWMYSSLKIDPKNAIILIYVYSILSSLIRLIWEWVDARKIDFEKKDVLEPVSVYTDIWLGNGIEYGSIFAIQGLLYYKILRQLFNDMEKVDGESDDQVWNYIHASIISGTIRLVVPSWSTGEWRPFWRHIFFDDKYAGYRSKRLYFRLFYSWIANDLLSQVTFFILPAILLEAEDDLEFVKDATSILFIAELDGLQSIDERQLVRPYSEAEAEKDLKKSGFLERAKRKITKSTSSLGLLPTSLGKKDFK